MNKVAPATFSYFDVGSGNGSDPEQIGFNIDEIVFHMQFPLEGTGGNLLSGYWIKHRLVIVISFCVLIGIIAIHCVWTKHGAYLKLRNLLCLCGFMISTSLLFGGIGGLAISLGVPTYIKQQLIPSGFIEDNYKDPQKVEIEFPKKKKRNLIWIYMESMESTFISKEEGGAMKENLLPEMTKLAKENINFSESSQVGGATASRGTDWTTGALFAQTCGLPMKLPIGHGDVGVMVMLGNMKNLHRVQKPLGIFWRKRDIIRSL